MSDEIAPVDVSCTIWPNQRFLGVPGRDQSLVRDGCPPLARSSRAMAVMAFARLIQCGGLRGRVRRETYVHGVVVSGAAERGQAPQERDGLLPRRRGQADVVAGKLGHNGETPGIAVSVAATPTMRLRRPCTYE